MPSASRRCWRMPTSRSPACSPTSSARAAKRRGRAMLAALIAGETDPERLAALAQGTARQKHAALVEALRGHVTPHHRTLLALHLQLVDALQAALAKPPWEKPWRRSGS